MSEGKGAHWDGRGMKRTVGSWLGGLDKKNLGGKRRWEKGRDEEMKRRWVYQGWSSERREILRKVEDGWKGRTVKRF
jgi:hypothetical protein